MGKKVPVGYKYNRDTKKIELSDDSIVIRRMFMEYLKGLSTKDIAQKFNNEEVYTTVGIVWTPSGISRLLNNVAYKGDSLYGKTTSSNGKRGTKNPQEEQILVENTHPPIIEKDIWDAVQKVKLERNSRPIALKIGKRKFSGLIKCALCSSIHSFQSFGRKTKKQRITSCQTRTYKDNDLKNYTLCENQGCNLESFEEVFFACLSKYIKELKNYTDLIRKYEPTEDISSLNKMNSLEKQSKKLNQDIKRVQQGFIMRIFTDEESQIQIEKLRKQLDKISTEITDIKNKPICIESDYYEQTMRKIINFLKGHIEMPEKSYNDVLREYIEVIYYKKTNETSGEIELDVVFKSMKG